MIDLPEKPAPATVTPAFIDYGRVIRGSLGGKDQRVDRPGSRWQLTVEMPPLQSRGDSLKYVSRLIRSKSEGCRIDWPLGDFDPGNPGRPALSVSEPKGTQIEVDGFSPNYIIKEGQFFSIDDDGQHFLHVVAEATVADANGVAQLSIWPHIRAPHPEASRCHFKKPMIEGYVQAGDEFQWSMAVDHNVGVSFTIREAE